MKKLCAVLALVLVALLAPGAVSADVHGVAYGFIRLVEPNFDGAGGCRMVILGDRYNVIDFPSGELADACAAETPGEFNFIEVVVDDAPAVPCSVPCPKVSEMSRYTAAGFP